ncbi:MAG TPA: hypothetical protein VGM54_26850 [Chthoniobacter sp.]|jgi:hypothetical protein
MSPPSNLKGQAIQLIVYWLVVGIPLVWGIWKTAVKLPALFQ